MTKYLYILVEWIAYFHDKILALTKLLPVQISDKDLHFLVIGALGLLLMMLVYPVFKWLNRKNHIFSICWIYVFTLIVGLSFAIEIGQKISGTGEMDFRDIVAGLMGFFAVTAVLLVLRFIWWTICMMLGIGKPSTRKRRR